MQDVEATYRRYFPLIREKCRRMLGDAAEADDVAQETFVRFWQSARDKDVRAASAFIYKTCTRLAVDRIRERARRPSSDRLLDEVADAAPASDQSLAARRELLLVARTLPGAELEVALLSRLDRLTHEEIAEVLGVSDRTVRRALARLDERVAALRKEPRW
ncbi:MAG TPA: sigma-70 family RNA polymerase sigma factor [Myxococcales bacterium]|nr:sigma-70 family RNA polymerase sigma factor [Myxococcales bacterium]